MTSEALSRGKAALARSRFFGRISALIFFLAALAVLDSLQTMIRHEFNHIDILPGESTQVSGMLPSRARSHKDLDVVIEGASCVFFTPTETYKGFWMGGHMWRADLRVEHGCPPGEARLTIVDVLEDKDKKDTPYAGLQNPALVFSVTVWPSDSAMRAADNSFFRRFTGLPAYVVAALAVLLALAAGFANWRSFSVAEKELAACGIFFILGLKNTKDLPPAGGAPRGSDAPRGMSAQGYRATFAGGGQRFSMGEEVLLYDRNWREQGEGRISGREAGKYYAIFPYGGAKPHYGWMVARKNQRG